MLVARMKWNKGEVFLYLMRKGFKKYLYKKKYYK